MAASEESQVGVGTTRPYYKLHVGGGEGNRGGIGATDITITGIATVGVANSSSGALNVLGISTFKGDIDLIGSAGISTVRWDASKDALVFQDNAYARFGTGEDLKIWHDGSNSYIQEAGTGGLIIYGTDETLAVFTDDGSVQLYNNDSKKLETTGLGITVYGDTVVAGVTTSARLKVTGISTFIDDVDFDSKIRFDESESALTFIDNAAIRVGTGSDLAIFHDGGDFNYIRSKEDLLIRSLKDVKIEVGINDNAGHRTALYADNLGDVRLHSIIGNAERLRTSVGGIVITGVTTTSDTVNVSTGATITATGNAAFAGIVTANGGVNVGTAVTIDAETGNVAISGITTIGGNLYVTGDITYDEVTGRNLNITGITTLADQVNFGTSGIGATVFANGNVAISGITTINGGIYVGTAASIHANGNLGITGIATADRFIGIHTSADGGGIGIGSTTAHVGYGITYIDFKGPGVSTVYSSSVTGITTIYFQGGGGSGVGAAGTWQNDGTSGISTVKSVGINTVGVAVTALMGGVKGASSGIGASMQGLYISNGMMVNDNQLNGNHYIGTAFGGIMAGPVTVNGVVTVDGNWAVV